VSICVPTEYHYEVAMKANDIGVNFLIEKPITDNFDEAVELAMSTSQNIVSGVGHIERFNPIVSEINKLVYEPVYLEINRHNPASNRIGNTSVIKDLMIHDIDIFRHVLFNDCEFEIYAMGDNDVCAVSFVVNYGGTTLPVFISSSRMSSKKTRRIYMEDINYTVEGDYMSQEIYIHKKPDQYSLSNNKYMQENIVEKVALNKIEPLRVELTKFLDCCLTGEEFPISLKEATTNLEICNKIEELVNAR
jgi:predicted dehydrogenase